MKKSNLIIYLIFFVVTVTHNIAIAQLKSIDNDSLIKKDFIPKEIILENVKETILYTLPKQDLQLEYKTLPAKPLNFQTSKNNELNWLQFGIGNLENRMLNFSTQLPIYKNKIQLLGGYQHSKGNTLQETNNYLLQANLQSQNTVYTRNIGASFIKNDANKYGYFSNPNLIDDKNFTLPTNYFVIQAFANWFKNTLPSHQNYWQNSFNGYLLNTNSNTNEKNFTADINYKINKNTKTEFSIGLKTQLNALANKDSLVYLNYYQPILELKHTNNINQYCIGLKENFNITQNYFLPYFFWKHRVGNKQSYLLIGSNSNIIQDNFKNILQQNVFANYNINKIKTGAIYKNYIGLILETNRNTSINLQTNYLIYNNAINYLNNIDSLLHNLIYTNYVSTKAFQFNIGILYRATDNFQIGSNFSYLTFIDSTINQIPKLDFNNYFIATLSKKIKWKTCYILLSGMQYFNQQNLKQTLQPINDLHTEMDFKLSNKISLFAQWNNILNSANNYWYRYNAYKSNYIIGLQFKNL